MDITKMLVVDIESTCWEKPKDQPVGQIHEIIEIGIAVIDMEHAEITESASLLIRPAKSKISKFCTKLTSITQEMVDGGMPFKAACRTLRIDFMSKDRPWLSWGRYDKKQFERQCKDVKVEYPFSINHTNLKNMFSMLHGLPNELGMAEALKHLNMSLVGTHHRGGDDAMNIANIFIHDLKKIRG